MHRYSVKPFELLYYMAFGLYLFIQLLSSSLVSALIDIRILRVSGFFIIAGLIFAKLMIDNTFRHLWIYLSLIVLLTIVGLHAANIRDLIILGMLTFGARNIKLEKIVLEDVIMIGIFLVIMPFLFATGLFRNVDTSTFRGVSGRMRLSLGYGWTTYSANYYLAMVTGILFLAGRRRRMGLPLMLMFLGNIVLFMLTDTKAAFFETTILLVIYSLITACKLDLTRFRVCRALLPLAFIVCGIIAIWAAFSYDETNLVMKTLNILMTNRLMLANNAVNMYPVTLFGNHIRWVFNSTEMEKYMYVDSSYVQILMQFGLLVLTYIIWMLTVMIRYYVRKKNNVAIICLTIIALHSVTDPQLFNVVYNPFLLGVGIVLLEVRNGPRKRRKRLYLPAS